VSWFAELRAELRQRRHRPEFRIPADSQLRARLARLLAEVPDGPPMDERLLADAATNLWRAQRRLARDDGRPTARDRQTSRYLTTCRDALTEAGVIIQDHEGDSFNSGRSIEVLVFQEDPELAGEVVIETVRPTIYLHDRRIQMGQVIVGGPPSEVRNDHAGQ
jgi:hypothetical protein